MKVEIYHKYSNLDNKHQFGIAIVDETESWKAYINWIWFYMGFYLGKNRPVVYPYKPSGFNKKPKVYTNHNDAQRQAKLIVNYIKRTCNK